MDTMFLLGEVFSLLSAVCLCYSTFGNSKNRMIFWQSIDSLLGALSNLFLFSFSGVVTNILAAIRNLFQIKDKNNSFIVIFFCFLNIVLGLLFNNREIVGLIPIIATIEYTVAVYVCKDSQSLRIGLLINTFIWGIYDLIIKSYPLFIADSVILIFTLFNIIRCMNKFKSSK